VSGFVINPFRFVAGTPVSAGGLVFHLDADQEAGADNATITPTDRGTLGLSLTGTVTLKTNILNSKKVLRFDGTSQRLVAGAAADFNFLHQGNEWTVIIVARVRVAAPGTFQVLMDSVRASANNHGLTLFYDDRAAQSRTSVIVSHIGRAVGSSYPMQTVTENNAFPGATWGILSLQHDLRKSSRNQGHVWTNGAYRHNDFAANASLGAHSSSDASNAMSIGSLAGAAGSYFDGDIAELRVYNRRLTVAEHAAVLDALAVKWGITVGYPIPQVPVQDSASYDAFGLFVRSPTGRLITAARSGVDHVGGVGDLVTWASDNSGETWDRTALKTAANTDYRNAAGGGAIPATGTLMIFYAVYNVPGAAFTALAGLRSVDNGATWADAALTSGLTLASYSPYGPLTQLPSGKLVQTFYEFGGGSYKVFTLASTDDGLTWGDRVDIYSGATAYTETSAVWISGATDGASTLLAFARVTASGGSIRQFKSTDGGASWSDMGNVPGTNFTSVNGVMAYPRLLPTGTLLLLVTDRGGTGAIQRFTAAAADAAADVANWSAATRVLKGFGADLGYASSAFLTNDPRSLAGVAYQGYTAQADQGGDADLWLFGVPT